MWRRRIRVGRVSVARLRHRTEAGLRVELLGWKREFRRQMCETFLGDQVSAEVAWRECSKAVDQLEAGKPYRLYRWELPDDHPERMVASINDVLLLTAGDELVGG
jgi:hypothetical protein